MACHAVSVTVAVCVVMVYVTVASCAEYSVVDMSHPFTNATGTIYWPGFKHFQLTNVIQGIQPAGFWFVKKSHLYFICCPVLCSFLFVPVCLHEMIVA